MFKIKCVLSFICLFMLEISITEAHSRFSNKDRSRTEAAKGEKETKPSTSSRKKCRYSLVSPTQQDIRFAGEEILGLKNVELDLQVDHLKRQFFNKEGPSIDPERTHIPELARLIDPYIDFVEKDIRSQDFLGKGSRLSQLEQLKFEIQIHQENRSLTYRKWLSFNSQLSRLTTYDRHQQIDIDHVIHQFPELIVMPLIFAVNESPRVGILFLNLNDNQIFLPHNMEHRPLENQLNDSDSGMIHQFESTVSEKIRRLLERQRERTILIYGQLINNYPGPREDISKITDKVILEDLIRNNIDAREFDEINFTDFVNFVLELNSLVRENTENDQVM